MIICCAEAYCHFSYTQVCWVDVVVLHISVTDAWKTNFIFNPIHIYSIEFLFFSSSFLLLLLLLLLMMIAHMSTFYKNSMLLPFLWTREHPKLWKLKNLCAWATIFSPRVHTLQCIIHYVNWKRRTRSIKMN